MGLWLIRYNGRRINGLPAVTLCVHIAWLIFDLDASEVDRHVSMMNEDTFTCLNRSVATPNVLATGFYGYNGLRNHGVKIISLRPQFTRHCRA